MAKKITINFDMDGTIADLYGVENWVDYLVAEQVHPYVMAKPLVNLSALARKLNTLQREGYNIAIVSWLSKSGTEDYNARVIHAKLRWLKEHLPSVRWNEIHIVPYGTPKQNFCYTPFDVLFDDEERNRTNWTGEAYDVQNIMEILRTF